MERIDDYADDRHKTWCIHCGRSLAAADTSLDHVPSRSLLMAPHPEALPAVRVCLPCNRSFSLDEEYVAAFLGCVLSGSTDPDLQPNPHVAAILAHSPALRSRIERSITQEHSLPARAPAVWTPELDRVHRVVLKNARGHAYFEWSEPLLAPPDSVWASPLSSFSATARSVFERSPLHVACWPEVGSRALTRLVSGEDLVDGWVVVQQGVYRYAVAQEDGVVVRSVLHEYLATEVRWHT